MNDSVRGYLAISPGYYPKLEGFRWSQHGDAVEFANGVTFAFSGEIGLFLEGFASRHRLISFEHLLHALQLLGYGAGTFSAEAGFLARLFKALKRPLRNAGALMGELCEEVAPQAGAPNAATICQWLGSPPLMAEMFSRADPGATATMLPQLTVEDFETIVLTKLRELRLEELYHWLRHGRGPAEDEGAQIARAVDIARPRSLSGILAKLTQRQRLAGAVPFISQMVAALTLPPRRLQSRQLPMGGYADVASRGQPEQLLPSQFILEDLEFVRRFASNELLYFRREEPHARLREELVLLLDQGVRTWGDVRVALGAAVFALGKLAGRRKLGFLVAGTSNAGQIVDPLQSEEESFSQLVEGSDLSAHPGLALERVLEAPAIAYRDVVLLTHPRTLNETDVKGAARRVPGNSRLFAVTVHERGQVQLCEFRHGTPVTLNQFQVDLTQAVHGAPAAAQEAAEWGACPDPWRGDVEPIGFPFRLLLTAAIQADLFVMDSAGDRLLIVTENNMLHVFGLRDGRAEVLPRGMVNGQLFTRIQAVLGVEDGFVACGILGDSLAAFHYDWPTRVCTGHLVVEAMHCFRTKWCYTRKYHCVVACVDGRAFAADLSCSAGRALFPQTGRFVDAAREAESESWPHQPLPILDGKSDQGPPPPYNVSLHAESGNFVANLPVGQMCCTPLQDGLPFLRGCRIDAAKSSGWNLAVNVTHRETKKSKLLLFHGRDGVLQHEFPGCRPAQAFALCENLPILVQRIFGNHLIVQGFSGNRMPLRMWPGRYHSRVSLELARDYLVIQVGKHWHLIQWIQDELQCTYVHDDPRRRAALSEESSAALDFDEDRTVDEESYFAQRFQNWSSCYPLAAASDNLGHVALLNPSANPVFIAFVFRSELALWTPDGTRYGPASLIGGPSTPHALLRIAQVVKNAWANPERAVQ
jgi:hypothetical protein